ncbi:hypothetical protein PPGU19_002080 [Paraburkholderia sp. PGU19]|nr:hypothetical protein PPGU19_002080 [Paraburkholderia sp. PGU19]
MKRGSAANGVMQGRRRRGKRLSAPMRGARVTLRRRGKAANVSWRGPWRQSATRAAATQRSVPGRTAASFFRQCRILAGANMSNEMPSKGRGRQPVVD